MIGENLKQTADRALREKNLSFWKLPNFLENEFLCSYLTIEWRMWVNSRHNWLDVYKFWNRTLKINAHYDFSTVTTELFRATFPINIVPKPFFSCKMVDVSVYNGIIYISPGANN